MDLQELIWTVKPGGPASFATPPNLPPRNRFRSCSAFAAASVNAMATTSVAVAR
jgi:hypothetical protein